MSTEIIVGIRKRSTEAANIDDMATIYASGMNELGKAFTRISGCYNDEDPLYRLDDSLIDRWEADLRGEEKEHDKAIKAYDAMIECTNDDEVRWDNIMSRQESQTVKDEITYDYMLLRMWREMIHDYKNDIYVCVSY